MKNAITSGAPGSGKDTQSDRLIARYGLGHVPTGDALRSEIKNGMGLDKTVKAYINKGQLILGEFMIDILVSVCDSFGRDHEGAIFGGLPHIIPQAETLEQMLADRGHRIAAMVELSVPEDGLMKRLILRGQESGRTDDNEEVIKKRLDVYHSQTVPLTEWYEKESIHHYINGLSELERITRNVTSGIDKF